MDSGSRLHYDVAGQRVNRNRSADQSNRVRLDQRRRLKLFHKSLDYLPGNRLWAALILFNEDRQRRFQGEKFDTRLVIGEEIDPALARRAHAVSGVKGEITARAKVFAASFTGALNDFTLVVRRFHVMSRAQIV